MLIVQICEILDTGDGVHRLHGPGRALSRCPGVTVVDCPLRHHLRRGLVERADVLILAAWDWDDLPLLELRRKAGRVTVVEANDHYFALPAGHYLSQTWNDREQQQWFIQTLRQADGVQTSVPALARLWQNHTTRPMAIFRNRLDDVSDLPARPDRPLTIGWGGSAGHLADWHSLSALLQRWLDRHPEIHLAVMTHESARAYFSLPPARYHFETFGPFADYLRFLDRLDIGFAPLLPTAFNRCRSDVKFLEYASRGVVGIFPELEPYRDSVIQGQTGLLYRDDEELFRQLDRLAADEDLRRQLRCQAHAFVQSQRLSDHIGERLQFYRQLLAQVRPAHTRGPAPVVPADLGSEVLSWADRDGQYLQLVPGAPEFILQWANRGSATREKLGKVCDVAEAYPDYGFALKTAGYMAMDLGELHLAAKYFRRAVRLDRHSTQNRAALQRVARLLEQSVPREPK
ncbi:MAG: glycosyltransferase [Planctomycetes bacterium]|nr:glycosyltransferase [Planctomycetota bacterium]